MPTSRTLGAILFGALLAMGCAPPANDDATVSEAALNEARNETTIAEGSVEAEGILLYVNDRTLTDAELLNKQAGVPQAVAEAIVAYRTDAGGKPRWFKTLAEIDAIPGTTAETFQQLLANARATHYLDEGDFVPPDLVRIVVPDFISGPLTYGMVGIEAGFDGFAPDEVVRRVHSRIPNVIHHQNQAFVFRTIPATHKAFTLGVSNLLVPNAPFGRWLRSLNADKITLLGTMSAVHPTVLRTEKNGLASYWVVNGGRYDPYDWASHTYPVVMRAHVRLETDPEGPGVRVFYPACPLKMLEEPTFTVDEDLPDL